MTIQELKRLRETEDKVEFKEAKRDFNFAGGSHADPRERRKCVLGYVVALANEGGGYLVLGVKETTPNELVGTAFADRKIGEVEDEIYKRLSVRVEVEELFEGGKRVLVFKIPARPVGSPLNFEGVPLMRIGDSLHVMSNDELFRILLEREPDFSATVCEKLTFEDLDPEAIGLMKSGYAIKQKNPAFETLPDLQVLNDLGLTKSGKFSYAALILLGKRDALREYLPNAEVIIEYRLNHSMIPYTARKEFQESLFTAIGKIWAYINQPASNPLLHVRHKFTIYDIPAFNEDVIREAVLNAVGHRSWRDLSSVVIKQYPDCISIINSGGFPNGVTKDNILTVNSQPRNKRVMEVLEKTGLVERAGQGVDKMYYSCLMEGKPLPDYSYTDEYQVDLCLQAKITDEAFYIFVNEVQYYRKKEDKLNVFDLLTLDKVRQGISVGLPEPSVEKLQREGLIKSQSAADKKYVLGDLYYEIAKQPAYIKEYRVRDLQIVAGCFEKAKEVSMKNFVDAFGSLLTREQIKTLIYKLENEKLLIKIQANKYTHYILNNRKIDIQHNIYGQFIEKLSDS
ncbi:MAG: putative DNA binding domain-containing protein [Prevotellaceae bacterium]|jgi:ATP-dependent DNA helicase RecG|nr:putative DNA binding domain-containing protein [Prevotellaceae bacterium]